MDQPIWCVNGLEAEVEAAPAAWGARAIWTHGFVDVLQDRQGMKGDGDDRTRLISLLNNRVPTFSALNDILVEQGFDGSSKDVAIIHDDDDIKLVCSPQQSYGYLYLTAILKG